MVIKRIRVALFAILSCAFLFVSSTLPALAQGGEEPQASSAPAGVGVLILMLGIGAILVIGAVYAGQGRSSTTTESEE